jgi:hypothetical protein
MWGVIMGQGRRFPHFWRCIILIATAIQGITPDPQDLASLKLLRMICPMVGSDLELQAEDESVDDVCEPLRTDQGSRIRQLASKTPLRGPIAIITCPEIFSPDLCRVASHRNDEPRPHGLIHSLGRLRC